MLVIRQKMIMRADLRANPTTLYIFGDNLERKGMGGQAREMRGEPNAFGIATKRRMSHGSDEDYMHDYEPTAWNAVDADFARLHEHVAKLRYTQVYDPAVVIPLDGIGTGLAKLSEYAPKLLEYINLNLENLRRL